MNTQNVQKPGQIILAPSLLAANFAKLGEQLAAIRRGGAAYLHLDVMDGLFVPNISFGTPVVKSLRGCSDLFFDVHLMIDRPERYISDYVSAGAELITFHYEATEDPRGVLEQIRAAGVKASVSVKPNTPVEVLYDLLPLCDMVLIMTVEPGFGGQKFRPEQLEKVRKLVKQREAQGLSFLIQADGGIGESNARACVEAGVDVLVAGSSVLGKDDPCAASAALLAAAEGRN
ncbi:MAG: ribulose-phosphate 3-epimerase [Oscillospiraceae bacterium]|nr:ribulose-phosphate 3-epimerase [Oscillospiraceae bacterium]